MNFKIDPSAFIERFEQYRTKVLGVLEKVFANIQDLPENLTFSVAQIESKVRNFTGNA